MHDYILNCVDGILRLHPSCGVVVTGDFNQLRDNFLGTHYGFKQLVETPTRQQSILDKVWTNYLSPVYNKPIVISKLGTSDHNMVLFSPSNAPSLNTGHKVKVTTRCMGRQDKALFASASSEIEWEELYHSESCQEKSSIYQRTMNSLMASCFPTKIGIPTGIPTTNHGSPIRLGNWYRDAREQRWQVTSRSQESFVTKSIAPPHASDTTFISPRSRRWRTALLVEKYEYAHGCAIRGREQSTGSS